jgi:hypothetical protein
VPRRPGRREPTSVPREAPRGTYDHVPEAPWRVPVRISGAFLEHRARDRPQRSTRRKLDVETAPEMPIGTPSPAGHLGVMHLHSVRCRWRPRARWSVRCRRAG